jgi:hypothetical protein
MNKKMRELLTKIQEKTTQAMAFMAEGENKDVEKATGLMDEVDALKAEYETEKRIFEAGKMAVPTEEQAQSKQTETAVSKFAKAVRSIIQGKGLVEGVDADGGYTVPEDIQELSDRKKPESPYQVRGGCLPAHVAHTDAHADHESGSPEEFGQIIVDHSRHDLFSQVQKHMYKNHSYDAKSL